MLNLLILSLIILIYEMLDKNYVVHYKLFKYEVAEGQTVAALRPVIANRVQNTS